MRQYQKQDKAGQEKMVSEYVLERMKVDSALHAVQEKLAQAASTVPVALDLGIVRLYRGREIKDPEAKKKELEAAEKVFLSIRNVAGESDAYRMYYGQVLYWLGKHEEGKAAFDELLASKNRNHETLLGVGNTLREIGAHSEANVLFEEAYNQATKVEEKQQAAAMRRLSANDMDDHILWLGRCDTSKPHVQASLEAAKGKKMLSDGDRAGAIPHLKASIAAWEKLPRSDGSLNEIALAQSSLFYASGDPEAFRQGAKLLREAVGLNPSDSILVLNAASSLLEASVLDEVSGKLNFTHGGISIDLDLLDYFAGEQKDEQALRARMQARTDFKDAKSLYRKAILLAPRNAGGYGTLREIYAWEDDLDALKELKTALKGIELVGEDQKAKTLAFYAGSNDPAIIGDWDKALATGRTQLASVPKDKEAMTWVVTAGTYIQTCLAAHAIGNPIELEPLFRMAQQAYAMAPSNGTSSILSTMHLYRAFERLAAANPAFKEGQERNSRVMSRTQYFALALEQIPALRDPARQDPDVKAALDLMREQDRKFPKHPSAWKWAVCKYLDPEEAEVIAKDLHADPISPIAQDVREMIYPMSGNHALYGLWLRRVLGQEGEGLALYEACRKRGVPLPEKP